MKPRFRSGENSAIYVAALEFSVKTEGMVTAR
jgi:hypothetical protein